MNTLMSVQSTTRPSPIARPRLNSQSPWILEIDEEIREVVEHPDGTQDPVQDHHRAEITTITHR